MTDKWISLLGFCRRAGNTILGAEDLKKNASRCELVFLAKNASERTARAVRENHPDAVLTDLTKEDLGKILGCREVAALGIADRGFAEAMKKVM